MTIQELIEEQRARMRSNAPAERFAAALLLSGVLAGRLRELDDFQLGQILDREVCSNLRVLAPELTVCMEAAERLCRRRPPVGLAPRRRSRALDDEGKHLLHAEAVLYRARIPHLLLPLQRDKFASDTFMVPSLAEAKDSLCRAGFCETYSPTLLVDCDTNRPIRLVEHV